MYDIVVIGSGPAGLTAAIYARRSEKSVLVLEKESFGGQITHSPLVENYPGFSKASGNEIAEKMLEQAMNQGADVELDRATAIEGTPGAYTVVGEYGRYECKSVIIATGSKHRTLGIDREEEFVGEGISYCAVCDGAFYRDKTVAVIGGGNSAMQEAVMLSNLCKSVTVVQNLSYLTCEKKLIADAESRDNVEIITDSVVDSIIADDIFRGIVIKNSSGQTRELLVDGVFVAIGQVSDNESFSDVVKLDERGYIPADESCTQQKDSGIFAAGDCRTKRIRQITTATADGACAAIAACMFVDSLA